MITVLAFCIVPKFKVVFVNVPIVAVVLVNVCMNAVVMDVLVSDALDAFIN